MLSVVLFCPQVSLEAYHGRMRKLPKILKNSTFQLISQPKCVEIAQKFRFCLTRNFYCQIQNIEKYIILRFHVIWTDRTIQIVKNATPPIRVQGVGCIFYDLNGSIGPSYMKSKYDILFDIPADYRNFESEKSKFLGNFDTFWLRIQPKSVIFEYFGHLRILPWYASKLT